MPSINLITTTAGRAAILGAVAGSSTLVVADAQLSDTNQSATMATTSLTNIVATLSAVGSVRTVGGTHSLHVVLTDDTTAAYDVRALALRLDDGTFLFVYSQAGVIASKVAGSSLHLALDLTIDADTAATITFGDTDYALPAASESAPGVVELATEAETITGSDALRAVTPATLEAKLDATSASTSAKGLIEIATAAEVDGETDSTRALVTKEAWRLAVHLITSMAIANRVERTPDAAFAGSFRAVSYTSLGFVAVGGSGEIQTSPDGTTWTHRNAAGGYADVFQAVTSSVGVGAKIVIAGGAGEIQSSPDGTTWTHQTPDAAYVGAFRCAAWSANNNLFVIAGDNGEIQTSPDGTTWTHRNADNSYTGSFRGLAYSYALSMFVAVGDNGEIQTSPNGTTWTKRTSGTTDTFYAVAAGNSNDGGFLAVGDGVRSVSSNGTTWSTTASSLDARGVAYSESPHGTFAACGFDGDGAWIHAPSGPTRQQSPRADITADLRAVCYGLGSFVFVGDGGTIQQSLYL